MLVPFHLSKLLLKYVDLIIFKKSMEQQTQVELKQKLEDERIKILKQLEGVGSKAEGAEDNFNAKFPEYGTSDEDNATEIADYTTNLSLEKNLEEKLRNIDSALKRIEEGAYGQCSNCQKEINIERLKIQPEADKCVECNV